MYQAKMRLAPALLDVLPAHGSQVYATMSPGDTDGRFEAMEHGVQHNPTAYANDGQHGTRASQHPDRIQQCSCYGDLVAGTGALADGLDDLEHLGGLLRRHR